MKIPLNLKPSKIICIGLNYVDHARELNMPVPEEPIIFLKPPSSIIGHQDKIKYPDSSERVDYEGELAIVIGRRARNIFSEEAKEYIKGYTCLNDVTARDLQKKDGQWTRAKSFDTFSPAGPHIETDLDPSDLKIKTYLNGELKQSSTTKNLIFDINYIVSFVSKIMTLNEDDIIATGTPPGIGPMQPGDDVVVEIAGIGRLSNKVV